MIKVTAIILLILGSMTSKMYSQEQEVDLIVHNAVIYTVDNNFSKATAFAVKNGKFMAIGKSKELLEAYSSENIIDAEGKYIYPGFNDGHSHFLGYGLWVTKYANLVGTNSFAEVMDRLIEHNKSFPGNWLLGRGWDQNDWEIKEFPTNEKLNQAFPDKAVVLTRIDGHAVIANDFALELAGIDANTKTDGGEVVLKNGKPTGVLVDNAADKMKAAIPEFNEMEKQQALLRAQEDCFAVGLTTVTDAGLDLKDILLIKKLQDEQKLSMRVYAMMSPTQENFDYFYPKGPQYFPRLTVSSVKLYSDGALGSRGALLVDPYSDDSENYGLQLHSNAYYLEMCLKAYEAGFQVNTHAIGDSGNRLMLKTYSKILKGKNDRRWRVEHAQIVQTEDLSLFKEYSIIPSVQATHCTSDMYWADERLGEERIKTAYAYKDLLLQNGWIINGTDFPIEGISPLHTFYAAVVRKDAKGWPAKGFQTENALSRENALRSITIWPAKGSFDENKKGSIEIGKLADFVILEIDLLKAKQTDLHNAKVVATFVEGEKVY